MDEFGYFKEDFLGHFKEDFHRARSDSQNEDLERRNQVNGEELNILGAIMFDFVKALDRSEPEKRKRIATEIFHAYQQHHEAGRYPTVADVLRSLKKISV